ncbi:hypothetical protein BGX23_007914 [Mortierella sp. AD031]|nr:hypothetical protein BGX23_007914 [Mortierella sp. AD031]
MQNHQYDSTLLNESPSALQRHLERKLRHQKRLLSAYKSSLHQQALNSYSSHECVAWRARQQHLQQKQQQERNRPSSLLSSHSSSSSSSPTDAALTRFQQFHPNRRDLDPKSIFAKTINAIGQKRYTDPNGYVVELDPAKVMAGSRRASTYLNDDLHVLVLDMQWDPEVTVVVGNVLDETVKLRQEGYRPVMLNIANSNVPGGDYHLDSTTDTEADLFRRTTLHQCLDQEPRRSRFYPLSEEGGVYCPNQAVFRHGYDRNNEFMDRFEWISVVSVAPIPKMETREKEGGLGGVQFLEGEDDMLRRRILAAMKVGVSQGHDALVLPPHGTDAGQNPSEAIAAIYRSIIGRDFMGGRKRFQTYKKIVMVLDPEQADKIVNETSSYRPTQPPPKPIATPLPVGDNEESAESESDDQDAEDEATEEEAEADSEMPSLRHRSDDEDPDMQDEDDNDNGDEDQEDSVEEVTEDETLSNSEGDNDETNDETNDDFGPSEDELEDQAMYGASDESEEGSKNQFVPEDEVSEEDALLEEQEPQEDVELSDGILAEDLNDIPAALDAESTVDSDEAQDDDESNSETSGDDDDDNEDGDDEEEDEETEEAEESFVPLVETVQQVFERMLEQRSLLIVKNRARGIVEPEEPAANATSTTVADATATPLSA